MKLGVVLLLLSAMLIVAITAKDVNAVAFFSLWMGGFVTSEVVSWCTKPHNFPLKEKQEVGRY